MAHLYEESEKKFSGNGYTAVGGFLFLRLLCPALVFPEKNFLVPADTVITSEVRRALTLLSKALQNLANGKKFREAYMEPLNVWFDESLEKLHSLLSAFIVRVALLRTRSRARLFKLTNNGIVLE